MIYVYMYLFLNASLYEKTNDSTVQSMNPGNENLESQLVAVPAGTQGYTTRLRTA